MTNEKKICSLMLAGIVPILFLSSSFAQDKKIKKQQNSADLVTTPKKLTTSDIKGPGSKRDTLNHLMVRMDTLPPAIIKDASVLKKDMRVRKDAKEKIKEKN